jgi:hypothetical protein
MDKGGEPLSSPSTPREFPARTTTDAEGAETIDPVDEFGDRSLIVVDGEC